MCLCFVQGVHNLVDIGTTNKQGMVVLVKKDGSRNIPGYTNSFAVVEYNGRIMVVPDIRLKTNTFSSKSSVMSVLLDRKLVRPGEKLFVKGELMGILKLSALASIDPLLQYSCFSPAKNVLEKS